MGSELLSFIPLRCHSSLTTHDSLLATHSSLECFL